MTKLWSWQIEVTLLIIKVILLDPNSSVIKKFLSLADKFHEPCNNSIVIKSRDDESRII